MTLGNKISEYRKQNSLTQEDLAEQMGITAQAVSKWENDQSYPDILSRMIAAGVRGRLLEIDTEDGEHIEISVQ